MVAVTARRLDPYSGSFWSMILTVILFSPFALYVSGNLSKLTPSLLLLNIFLGIILITGIIAYREGFRIGNVALVTTIGSAFTALTSIFGIIFFNERLTLLQVLLIIIIFVGLFLSTFDTREIIRKKVVIDKGVLLGFVAMICWSIYFAFIKIPSQQIGWFWPNYFSFLIFPLIYLYMRLKGIKLDKPSKNGAIKALIISTILVRVAELSFNFGISKGLVTIVAPIAGANPILFVIAALLFFKDPITKQQILGIITTLMGIVLLSVFSV